MRGSGVPGIHFAVAASFQHSLLSARSPEAEEPSYCLFELPPVESILLVVLLEGEDLLCNTDVFSPRLWHRETQTAEQQRNKTVKSALKWASRHRGCSYPPVEVPPMRSKKSAGRRSWSRRRSYWIRLIICSRTMSSESPRMPPPSTVV